MQTDPHPRYVTTLDGLFVLDRWYCHREVYRASFDETPKGGYIIANGAREAAKRRCAEWNAEHDAWLAAG